MSAQNIDDSGRELGLFSIVLPVIWAMVAVGGFALVADWPELFAASEQAGPVTATAAAATQVSPDQPVPEASKGLRAPADSR